MFEDQDVSPITSGPYRDRAKDQALADSFGTVSIRRSIVEGQRGYTVSCTEWSAPLFCFTLRDAFGRILNQLGHGNDREMMILGEDKIGNQW